MKKIKATAAVLVIIGAINWGLIGLFDFDLIDFFLSPILIDRVFDVLIGAAGVYQIVSWVRARNLSK